MLVKVRSAAVNGIEEYPVAEGVNAGFGDKLIASLGSRMARLSNPETV